MRIAILSDIHANLAALEAVIRKVDDLGISTAWCLGDIVGYVLVLLRLGSALRCARHGGTAGSGARVLLEVEWERRGGYGSTTVAPDMPSRIRRRACSLRRSSSEAG